MPFREIDEHLHLLLAKDGAHRVHRRRQQESFHGVSCAHLRLVDALKLSGIDLPAVLRECVHGDDLDARAHAEVRVEPCVVRARDDDDVPGVADRVEEGVEQRGRPAPHGELCGGAHAPERPLKVRREELAESWRSEPAVVPAVGEHDVALRVELGEQQLRDDAVLGDAEVDDSVLVLFFVVWARESLRKRFHQGRCFEQLLCSFAEHFAGRQKEERRKEGRKRNGKN